MTRHAPVMHALTGPARYGLCPVRIEQGMVRRAPSQQVLCTGDLVLDQEGHLCAFIALDEDDTPVLERVVKDPRRYTNRRARRKMVREVHMLRLHHDSQASKKI